jgi:hypothetical protein
MNPPRVNIKPLPLAIHRPILRIPVPVPIPVAGVRNRQLAAEDDVGGETGVGVRCVVFLFCLFACQLWCVCVVCPRIRNVGGGGGVGMKVVSEYIRTAGLWLWLTCAGPVGPDKDVREAPGADFCFCCGFGFGVGFGGGLHCVGLLLIRKECQRQQACTGKAQLGR